MQNDLVFKQINFSVDFVFDVRGFVTKKLAPALEWTENNSP